MRFRHSFPKKVFFLLCVFSVFILVINFRTKSFPFAKRKLKKPLFDKIEESWFKTQSTQKPEEKDKDKQVCVHPKLSVSDPVMKKFYKKPPKVNCKGDENWVYIQNGTIRFSSSAVKQHGNILCEYQPIIRGPGDYKLTYQPTVKISDGDVMKTDFIKVNCSSADGNSTYENVHAGISPNQAVRSRLQTQKPRANGLGLSVAILGFDSMSRMSWLRHMPKTRDYFVNDLGAFELEGYNIMGDGTPAALFPILTGKHEQELPEARRGFKGAKPVDSFPWIWKDFHQNGYVTSWADAEIHIAPFNYRLLGFQNPPTDYFMRPFYLGVYPYYKTYSPYCHASQPKHQVWFNWARDIFYMYKNDPKFMMHFFATISHSNNNLISIADEDLRSTVKSLEQGGFLNNTLLILMADHGARFSSVRGTLSGKLEERLPYFSLRFPPWFLRQYPALVRNLRINSQRLTTPMDIHETLRDILRFDGAGLGDVRKRGISLFKEIPFQRTCGQADVAPHWCACLGWVKADLKDKEVQRALQTAVDTINSFTKQYRKLCAELSVHSVTLASKLISNEAMLRFDKTTGDRGLNPVMNNKKMKNDRVLYQMTFYMLPSMGLYEVTIEHDIGKDKMTVNPKAISRINKYGDQPACILDKNREIRQYCFCKDNSGV